MTTRPDSVTFTCWVNLYADGEADAFSTEWAALSNQRMGIVECRKLVWTYYVPIENEEDTRSVQRNR